MRVLHRFALLLVGATFILIFIGGLVTSTGSALAVPDWPLSFGTLFPKLEGGVLYEHGHRMAAGTVSILALAFAIWAWRSERRAWVCGVAVAAFGLIVVQAVLGGLTVLLKLPLAIAVAHAATAQAFFCLTAALAVFTSRRWVGEFEPIEDRRTPTLGALGAATTAIIYVQILIGALMRHMGAGLAIPDFPLSFGRVVPPLFDEYIAVNFAHRCGAVIVSVMIIWTVTRVLRDYRGDAWLRRPALALVVLLATQVGLGAMTVWSGRAVLATTAHVAIGAATLATALTLALRAYRMSAGASMEAQRSVIAARPSIPREATA